MVVKKNILSKLYIITILMTLFLVVIIISICNLQYIDGNKYRKLSAETTIKNDTIFANRGNVYASDGNLLATSMSKFTIRMDVMSVKSAVFEKNISGLATSLSQLFGKSTTYYKNLLRNGRKRKNRYLLIARNVGYSDYIKMKEFPIFNLGVYQGGFIAEQKTVRAHPIGKIAERTVGYDDHRGGAGIEGAFASYMKGKNGWRLKQKIAKGQWKPISDVNEQEPVDGRDVVTTIDVNMQDITHHALLRQMEQFNADHGCAVIMETETGEIKAIANLGRTSKGTYYEKRNYAVWESHEPGSTFKLASLLAALEDKVIDTSTVVDTEKGKIFINNKKIEDSHKGEHGKMSIARVFELSSNVGVVKAIRKHYDHQPKKFTDRLRSFGLDKQTNVQIQGEGKPYIPSPKSERWSPITLEWMSWGYGVSLTPLQMLTFYNAVANNGELVQPRFVKELRKGNTVEKRFDKVVIKEKIASKTAIKKVKKMMENVVKKGTAKNIYSPIFSMAGKTGTTKKWIPKYTNEKGEIVHGYYSSKHYVSSFAGFFPIDTPKYSCIVVIHNPDAKKGYYGAVVAAPVFKEIAHKIYTSTPDKANPVSNSIAYDGIRKNYKKYDKQLSVVTSKVPNVTGMPGMDAVALLETIGLKVKFIGTGRVTSQSIKRGEDIKKGSTIILKLS